MSVKKADHVQEELKRGNDMSRSKIDNTFMRSMEQIENLEKVFREGGLLEKAVMDIKGDIAWLKDIREALSGAYEAIQEGHQGTTGHLDMPDESVDEDHYNGGRLGFSDIEKFGDEAASKIDMEARRRGSADMEPGDADKLRYKVAKELGYLPESTLTEGVLDSDDDDGFMARSQLYFMARDAIELHGMIDDRDDLQPWVQSKIAQSAEAIDAVRRYTEYNSMKQGAVEPDMDEGYTILPPIDRDKYQERDGLEGPIPTKSGKVLYYDPKAGKYYDPDKDMYISYDDWKGFDESIEESIMEGCGCEQDTDIDSVMRFLQLKAEGRDAEAEAMVEAVPLLVPLAVHGARFAAQRAAPWVIRQIAGRGAGNVARKVAQRGVKRAAQVTKRALRRPGAKGKAAASGGANAAIYGMGGGDSGGSANLDYLTKMNASADEGKPAINEMDEMKLAAIGRVLQDMSEKGGYDDKVLNMLARVGNALSGVGTPFGPRNMKELSKATLMKPEDLQKVIAIGKKRLEKEGEPKVADKEPAEGTGFVKALRKQLEGKYANDAQRKAVHAAKAEKK